MKRPSAAGIPVLLLLLRTVAAGNVTVVESLIDRLDHPLWSARRDAAQALAAQAPLSDDAIIALVTAIDDADSRVRRAAVHTLGQTDVNSELATHGLIHALSDNDWVVRRRAALSFRGRQVGAAIEHIRQLLANGSTEAKVAAAIALGGLAPEESHAAIAELEAALEADDWRLRAAAVQALGEMRDRATDALPALAFVLRDPDWGVAEQVVEALSRIGEPALPVLIEAMTDPALAVRWGAARSVGRIGPAAVTAVPALATVLEDASLTARWAAAKSLWAIGPAAAAAAPALVEVLNNDTSWVVRWSAARALGAIAPEAYLSATVSALAAALQDRDSRVCEAAAFALEAIGPRASDALPALGRAATGAGRSSDEPACQVIDVGPTAEQLLMDNGWTVRWAAVRALAVVGANRKVALQPLMVAMQDEQWQVRGVAVLAIGQFNDFGGPASLAAIRHALNDENPAVRKAATIVNDKLSN